PSEQRSAPLALVLALDVEAGAAQGVGHRVVRRRRGGAATFGTAALLPGADGAPVLRLPATTPALPAPSRAAPAVRGALPLTAGLRGASVRLDARARLVVQPQGQRDPLAGLVDL